MAVPQPRTAPAVPAAPAARLGRPPDRPAGRLLLLAVLAACAYAAFAQGATQDPDEARLQVGLVVVALLVAAGWAGPGAVRLRTSRVAWVGLALLVAFGAWTGLTLAWSITPDRTWLACNRALAYALVCGLGVAVGSSVPRAIERVAVGFLGVACVVALYALGGKALPGVHVWFLDLDQAATVARLRAPLGYWNALALLLALATPVALRVATDRTRRGRERAAGLLALWGLLVVIGLTYSRGGGLAVGVAVAAVTVAGGGRLRGLAVLALAGVAAAGPLAAGFGLDALRTDGAPLADRTHAGLQLLGVLVVVAVALVLVARALLAREGRWLQGWGPRRSRLVWRGAATAAAALLLLAAVDAAVAPGGVRAELRRADHSFTAVRQDAQDDPGRLASTTSGNRWVWWKEAAGAFADRPLGGWGAGSFASTHLRYRTNTLPVVQPHSVALQFLAETGIVGLGLAVAAFAALGLAAWRRVAGAAAGRERDLASALGAACAAWAVHGCFDWDWDIPGVTVPVLLFLGVLAGGVADRARRGRPRAFSELDERPPVGRLVATAGAALVLCAFGASAALPSLSQGVVADAQLAAGSPGVQDAGLGDAAARADLAGRLDPLATGPPLAQASIAIARGRLVEARDDALQAVRREPQSAAVWARLATVAFALADRQGFVDAADRALALDPQEPRYRLLAQQAQTFLAPADGSATATGTPLAPAG